MVDNTEYEERRGEYLFLGTEFELLCVVQIVFDRFLTSVRLVNREVALVFAGAVGQLAYNVVLVDVFARREEIFGPLEPQRKRR